jgi:hypothetical protein
MEPTPGQARARCELAFVLSGLGFGDEWVKRTTAKSVGRPFLVCHYKNVAKLAIDARQLAQDFSVQQKYKGSHDGGAEAFEELCKLMEDQCDEDAKRARQAAKHEGIVRRQARAGTPVTLAENKVSVGYPGSNHVHAAIIPTGFTPLLCAMYLFHTV